MADLTNATDVFGVYIDFRCLEADLQKPYTGDPLTGGPPRIVGVTVQCVDTYRKYTWEGDVKGWVEYGAGPLATGVIHDDTLKGDGRQQDPLRVYVHPPLYDPNEAVEIGDVREGIINNVQGIWKFSAGSARAWMKHPVYVYDELANAHAFNVGDEFSVWFPGYEGWFFRANVIFTAGGIPDMMSHILQGDVTFITNTQWAQNTQYNIGEAVYITSPLDKANYYTALISIPGGQLTFSEFTGTSFWKLLADVSGTNGNNPPIPPGPGVPGTPPTINGRYVGEMIRWHWFWNWLPAGWLKCDGSLVLKSQYPLLYQIVEDTEGTGTAIEFNLPNENNTIIFTGVI